MDSSYIDVCIEEAKLSYQQGDVPIGAVIVQNGKILAKGHNTREFNHDVLGHAEINVIREASKILKRWNLADCELYVTLKPCSMCTEIIKQSRILKVFYLLDKLDYKKEFSKSEFSASEKFSISLHRSSSSPSILFKEILSSPGSV